MPSLYDYRDCIRIRSRLSMFDDGAEALHYYVEVVRLINDVILRTASGVILFDAIKRSGQRVTIQPLGTNEYNAFASPSDWADATPAGRTALQCGGAATGQAIRGRWQHVDDRLGTDWFDDETIGTGEGTASTVRFTPGTFANAPASAASCAVPGGAGWRADEVLFHELCHSYRHTVGRALCDATNMGTYDTLEEFFAIVVANVYLSENGGASAQLRSNHHGFCTITTPAAFPSTPRDTTLLARIRREERAYCGRLHNEVTATFNPF